MKVEDVDAIWGGGRRFAIMKYLAQHGPSAVIDIQQSTGISQPLTSYHLRVMVTRGIIRKDTEYGHRGMYYLDEAAIAQKFGTDFLLKLKEAV